MLRLRKKVQLFAGKHDQRARTSSERPIDLAPYKPRLAGRFMNQAIAEPEEGPDLTVKQELRPIQKERHKRPLFPQKEQHANPTTNATASQLHETLNSWKEIASYL